jgi:hypothetical protein
MGSYAKVTYAQKTTNLAQVTDKFYHFIEI